VQTELSRRGGDGSYTISQPLGVQASGRTGGERSGKGSSVVDGTHNHHIIIIIIIINSEGCSEESGIDEDVGEGDRG